MTLPSIDLLVDALQRPESVTNLRPAEWDLLIRQARQTDLLARLAAKAVFLGLWDRIPARPRMHLGSSLRLADRQHVELMHEVAAIQDALVPMGLPVVLLKGTAYVMSGLSASMGRMVSDVDILVPRQRLVDVESALMMAGWVSTNRDAYDQRYYRTWMQELPPLRHKSRGTVLDVHHAIIPLTARNKPDSGLLLSEVLPVNGHANLRVLARPDMVLHSAAHLFHEGELELGLRGLVDLDALLVEFSHEPGFWEALVGRAEVLDLDLPLFYAFRYVQKILGTSVPEKANKLLRGRLGTKLSPVHLHLMDALYLRCLRPPHPSATDSWMPLARFALYLRGHWLRMPPWLLTKHLLRKLGKSVLAERQANDAHR